MMDLEMDLFYPEIRVTIEEYELQEGIEIEVYSSADSYFDWAKVRFTEQFQDKLSISRKAPASIELGYDGEFHDVFEGYVVSPYSSANQNEIILKDGMILLEETIVSNTFLDVTPQEMLNYLLGKAGISNSVLSPKMFPKKARLPILQKTALAVIEDIRSIWKAQMPFFFSGNVFYWGEQPEQPLIYEFVYAENIISLERSGGAWELETVSVPFVRHSHVIRVQHPKVSGEFAVKKVVFSTSATGFIRTRIYF
ncbi:serine/arginine repetitive matrix protein 2 [Paenibacillus dendritiformis]|uniref:serine/arginine repetitive matrix protein 2 n=2 Tax=Paenibacillus TaxID=44249 RepID=UPI0020BDC089|nr:serine/arginine repetitive matrix protein 2 [Paenibacillus dendritiformis]